MIKIFLVLLLTVFGYVTGDAIDHETIGLVLGFVCGLLLTFGLHDSFGGCLDESGDYQSTDSWSDD